MKTINTYINEKLRLTTKRTYTCHPKDKKELKQIIIDSIENEGPNCDLNDIDVSKITNMSCLFDANDNKIFKDFNGDISQWDVSSLMNMNGMFYECEQFDCDISKWNVSNAIDMSYMFYRCEHFNQDLNSWDVSNVKYMRYAFRMCPTQPEWYK